jgi:ribosome-associated protein
MSQSYLEIQLDKQPIELCKLLKIADLVTGGGEAKVAIGEGYVMLNGEVEYQKRKKVYHEDIVEFNGETLQVVINENLDDVLTDNSMAEATSLANNIEPLPVSLPPKQNKSKNKDIKKAIPTNVDTAKQSKRKPISF